MIKKLALGILLMSMPSADAFAQPDPEGAADSFYVTVDYEGAPVEALVLKVRFFSDNTGSNRPAAFGLPLYIDATDSLISDLDTSVSTTFNGSMDSSFALKVTSLDTCCGGNPSTNQFPIHFLVGAVSLSGGISGDGLFCNVRLMLEGGTNFGTICIDTLTASSLTPSLVTEYAEEYKPRWHMPNFYGSFHNIIKCFKLNVTDYKDQSTSLPSTFLLEQNLPNPFNATTQIRFNLPVSSHIKLEVFDILGRKVATLVNEFLEVGYKQVVWDGKNDRGKKVASGTYFYRLKAGDFIHARKMVLLK